MNSLGRGVVAISLWMAKDDQVTRYRMSGNGKHGYMREMRDKNQTTELPSEACNAAEINGSGNYKSGLSYDNM